MMLLDAVVRAHTGIALWPNGSGGALLTAPQRKGPARRSACQRVSILPSHGENRGSSSLGSANDINGLAETRFVSNGRPINVRKHPWKILVKSCVCLPYRARRRRRVGKASGPRLEMTSAFASPMPNRRLLKGPTGGFGLQAAV